MYRWKFCESASHVAVTCEICFQNWLPWHRTHRGLLAQKSLEEFKSRKPWSHPPYSTSSGPENIFPPPYFLFLPQGPDTYHLEFWVSFVNCWESWVWQKCCALYSSSDVTRITLFAVSTAVTSFMTLKDNSWPHQISNAQKLKVNRSLWLVSSLNHC